MKLDRSRYLFLTINLYFGTKSCKLSCYVSVERPYVQKEIHLSENNCIHYLALGHTKGLGAQWLSGIECLARDRGAAGSSLTGVSALWSLSKTHLS